jgi:hypothetical protein
MKTTLLSALLATSAFAAAPAPAAKYDLISRLDFNTRAIEHHLPLFWRTDANDNKTIEPDELAILWTDVTTKRADWVDKAGFTKKFAAAYTALSAPSSCAAKKGPELKRCETMLLELSQGRPTLVENEFIESDRPLVERMQKVAVLIEKIYARQTGVEAHAAKLAKGDDFSHAVFFRNQSPFCAAPKTENDPECNALAAKPKNLSGMYPAEIQADKEFCAMLEKQPNGKDLMDHFSVVAKDKKDTFKAVPYTVAYKKEMDAIATELEGAAKSLESTEVAFRAYLSAAATAFRTNNWEPANEAWVAMGAENSKYYLRVAPDEVYFEPCAWKAGFALQFAKINKDSLEWQRKLEPVKSDLEKALATLAGPPYAPRDVKGNKLPDFIDVVINAADQRNPHGATIGQSLPNWGPVAEKGGRTVAMTNLYTDADSMAAYKDQMASMFCPATFAKAEATPKGGLMSTVLHEAAHKLGPSDDYLANGKKDDEVFGGPLAATMEELKAQTSAMYMADWLAEKKVITVDEAEKSHVRDIAWGFGHISRGMYSADGKPKNYSQLASIQQGFLRKAGALTWKAAEKAANGTDVGCVELDLVKFKTATAELEKQVLGAKSRGDRAAAEKLKADFVDAKDEWEKVRGSITERWLRAPKASFVYSVKL